MTIQKWISLCLCLLGFCAPFVYRMSPLAKYFDSRYLVIEYAAFLVFPSLLFWSASIVWWGKKSRFWVMWVLNLIGVFIFGLLAAYGIIVTSIP
jgi:hypothetical protein